MQDIGFTAESKNLNFIYRLSGHFLEPLWDQELVLCAVMDSRTTDPDINLGASGFHCPYSKLYLWIMRMNIYIMLSVDFHRMFLYLSNVPRTKGVKHAS